MIFPLSSARHHPRASLEPARQAPSELESLAPWALALSIQDFWRSRMKFEFGDHPSTVTKIGPAASVVENLGSSRHRDL